MKPVNPRLLFALASSAAILMLVACASDEKNGENGGPEQTPRATLIPVDPLPTVEGRTVTSLAKGYRATYPEGWEPRFNLVNAPTQKLDAYFAPAPEPGAFRATIAITCEAVAPSVDSQAFFDKKIEGVRSFADGEVTGPEPLNISGTPAFRVQYSQQPQTGEDVAKIDIFAANKVCGYTISLSSSPEELAANLTSFQEFVGSMSFQ